MGAEAAGDDRAGDGEPRGGRAKRIEERAGRYRFRWRASQGTPRETRRPAPRRASEGAEELLHRRRA